MVSSSHLNLKTCTESRLKKKSRLTRLEERDKSGQTVAVLVLLGGFRCLNEDQKEKLLDVL